MHLTAYTVLKRQLLDCLGQFLESNGGQFLASAEAASFRPRTRVILGCEVETGYQLVSGNTKKRFFSSFNVKTAREDPRKSWASLETTSTSGPLTVPI